MSVFNEKPNFTIKNMKINNKSKKSELKERQEENTELLPSIKSRNSASQSRFYSSTKRSTERNECLPSEILKILNFSKNLHDSTSVKIIKLD